MDLNAVQLLCQTGRVKWTKHSAMRFQERGIYASDILHCISVGEVIEDYPDDFPYPSCLILGTTEDLHPLHVVLGTDNEAVFIITAYFPNPDRWSSDFRSRKKG